MRPEAHIMKVIACVDTTMEQDRLDQTMAALEHFRAALAGTPTLRHCTELGVLGFDEIRFTLQPLAPPEQVGPLPRCPQYAGKWIQTDAIRFPTYGSILLSNFIINSACDLVWPLEAPAGYRAPTHTVIILLTHRISPASQLLTGQLTSDQKWLLSRSELYAQQWLAHPKTGGITLVPFCIDFPARYRVLAGNGSEGFPAVFAVSSYLDASFDRLRLLLLRILTYAPGRAPVVEDVPAQFLSGQPLAYPAASPLEFEPVVLGWDEVEGSRED